MIKTQCTGEAMIFKREFDSKIKYSCTISKKGTNGEYENAFITIQFKKGVELAHKQKINLTSAWLTFYKTKDDKDVFYIFCNEFESDNQDIPNGFMVCDDDDIPFK